MAGSRDAGMQLSALKLASPHSRTLHSARSMLHSNLANVISSPTSPCGSPSLSPRLSDARIDDSEFTSFEQHCAAIPFKWEESPGTPRNGGKSVKEEDSGPEDGTSASWSSSYSNSEDLSMDNSDVHAKTVESCPSTKEIKPTDRFALPKTHVLPLKPPPRMQAAKQPLVLAKDDNSVSPRSFNSVITNTAPRKSFRKDRLKARPFLSSPRKDHEFEELKSTMLGFEEWPKLEHNGAGGEHHRASLSFSFRKKHEEKEDEVDAVSNKEFSQKGGLGENRPLSSTSSRGLTDGYNFRSTSWASGSYVDDSDCELDAKTVFFDSAEDTGKDQQQEKDLMRVVDPIESLKQKPKKHAFTKLTRFFRSTPRTPSVLPAPLPPLPSQRVKAKPMSKYQHPQGTSTNTLLKMCLSNAIGQALVRNVKPLRQFDIHPRCAAAKQRGRYLSYHVLHRAGDMSYGRETYKSNHDPISAFGQVLHQAIDDTVNFLVQYFN